MNSQQLLFINFLIFLILVLYLLRRSKGKQPVQLNLKAPPLAEPVKPPQNEVELSGAREVSPEKTQPKPELLSSGDRIFFVYNGHEWEAHEVLGLRGNCNLQEATVQYQHLIKTTDPSSFEFYDSAYSALLKTKSKR